MYISDNITEKLKNNFLRISKIPRESGHEEKIADFFVNIAKKNNLYYFKDENNNVLIKKKGTSNSEPIALQAHLDMVCVKGKNSKHDFSKDGIEVIIDGDKVTAKDTSLGADQGVGLAIMLTLLEDNNLSHPNLEFLFTAEEETTFKGAVTFPYSKVESKRVINLDNSKDNSIVIGSDGDVCNEYSFKGNLIKCDLPGYKVLIDNFPSGSSSENINLSKGNGITTMAILLKDKDVFIKSINGGANENDLASWCEVILNTDIDVYSIFKNAKIESVDSKLCFSKYDTNKIINEILSLKCGLITDKSSGNLGFIKTNDKEIKIYHIFRSMSSEELKMIVDESKSLNNDFIVKEVYADSIWNPNYESLLLKKYKEIYFKEYNCYPDEEITHGTVECSAIKKRIDGLDIISVGCNIEKYHTPYETTYVSSWIKTYKLLIQFLELLANSNF